MFEEMIHTAQYKIGKITDTKSRIICEIEAQEKLIKNQKAYQLTDIEVKQTKVALENYKKELEKLLKRGD